MSAVIIRFPASSSASTYSEPFEEEYLAFMLNAGGWPGYCNPPG